MARSRAARRRRAQNGNSVPYAMHAPSVSNWLVGGSATDNTGAVLGGAMPTGPTTWNIGGASSVAITSGQAFSYQAVAIVSAPNTSTPSIGRMRVDEIKGALSFSMPSGTARVAIGIAIYVSEWNSNTSKWSVVDPLNPSDAARDIFFMLHAEEYVFPVNSAMTALSGLVIPLKISEKMVIGGGQAVHVTVNASLNTGGTVVVGSAFRTRVGPVA